MEFRRRIGQLMAARQGQVLQQINVGKSLLEVAKHATDTGLTVPGELTLLGKALLQLDEIGSSTPTSIRTRPSGAMSAT